MNEQEREAAVARYLRDLDGELGDVPASRRRELLEDVRGHIDEAWAESEDRSHAALLNILERLGSPRDLAREERERLGIGPVPQRQGPGFLEVAAVAMTVIFWPVGVLLAWLSPRWYTSDKAVATLLPVIGLTVLMVTSVAAFSTVRTVAGPARVVEVTPAEESPGPAAVPPGQPRPEVRSAPAPEAPWSARVGAVLSRVLVLFGLVGAPPVSAIYLALRMLPNPRRAAILLPVAAAAAVVLGALGAFLTPVVT